MLATAPKPATTFTAARLSKVSQYVELVTGGANTAGDLVVYSDEKEELIRAAFGAPSTLESEQADFDSIENG